MKTAKNATRKQDPISAIWTDTSETLHAMQLDASACSVVDIETGVLMLLQQMTAIRRELPIPANKLSDASVTKVLEAINRLKSAIRPTTSAVDVQGGIAAVLTTLMEVQMAEEVLRMPQALEALLDSYRAQGYIVEAADNGYSVHKPNRKKSDAKTMSRKRVPTAAARY